MKSKIDKFDIVCSEEISFFFTSFINTDTSYIFSL